jgi:hypothetical protein
MPLVSTASRSPSRGLRQTLTVQERMARANVRQHRPLVSVEQAVFDARLRIQARCYSARCCGSGAAPCVVVTHDRDENAAMNILAVDWRTGQMRVEGEQDPKRPNGRKGVPLRSKNRSVRCA